MRDGHFDYRNGFHGRVYLNPHQLFQHPSTIWRLAQDLLDVAAGELLEQTDIVAGPATGGALLAHTMAGLLDGRRALTHPACSFAPFTPGTASSRCASFYARLMRRQARAAGRRRAEYGEDVRALRRRSSQRPAAPCSRPSRSAIGWKPSSTSASRTTRSSNIARPRTIAAAECPMCAAGEPVTAF